MDSRTRTALSEALTRELQAHAHYRAAIGRFGSVYPFFLLEEAVELQIDALRPICRRNGIEPSNRTADPVAPPDSLAQVLRDQAASEEESANRYEELLGQVDDPVVRLLLSRLEEACRYQRLPLLRRARDQQKV
ncbi:MAG: hypothetical protein WCE62_14420 [Polyangiales bacterium]